MLFSGIALALSILLSVFIGRTGGHWSPFIGWSYSSMFIPALSLFLVIVFFKAPAPVLRWDVLPVKWLPVALFLLPVALHAVLLPLYAHFNNNRLPLHAGPNIVLSLFTGLAVVSVLAFFEEIGWRVWLLTLLQQMMDRRRSLCLAAFLCAIWHVPYDLSGIHYMPGVNPAVQMGFNLFGEFGAALVFGWLWVRTRSIWIVCLSHGALNNWGQLAFKYLPDLPPGNANIFLLAGLNATLFAIGLVLIVFFTDK